MGTAFQAGLTDDHVAEIQQSGHGSRDARSCFQRRIVVGRRGAEDQLDWAANDVGFCTLSTSARGSD